MRRMAFSATIDQMRDRSKTVTRRHPDTWATLEPGDQILAIEKGMGLARGEKQVPIGVIEIISNRVELLVSITDAEVHREGFPDMSAGTFLLDVWRPLHGPVKPGTKVRRIRFRHLPDD